MNARLLGRLGIHLHGHSGQRPCGECESGHPIGRRSAKRREQRQVQREIRKGDE